MTMTSEEAQEIIRLLRPVSKYCELKLKLDDLEAEAQEAEEDTKAMEAEETDFRALSPEQKVQVFDGVMRTLIAALPEYESITTDGVADGDVDEVQDYLDEQGYSNLFDYDAPEIQQLMDKIEETLAARGD